MKNAYILHGLCDEEEYFRQDYPSPSNFHWIPWLQKQLLLKGYSCQTPEMPTPFNPSYSKWKSVFENYHVDAKTSLIGHSCGSGFFLRWLSESKKSIDKLVMVAPWLDPQHTKGKFLDFLLDAELPQRVSEIHIFYSSDEPVEGVKESVDLILSAYPSAQLHQFDNMGHFCLSEMKTEKFPQLLKIFG